jgi:hypothetical protein
MGAPHQGGSQEKLHGLFPGFSSLLKEEVAFGIQRGTESLDVSRPLRVLDIGAGSVPYREAFKSFPPHSLDLVFLDRQSDLPGEHALKLPLHKWITSDLFDLCPILPDSIADSRSRPNSLGGKFDIIIIAAALHELWFDAVTDHGWCTDFHSMFFRFVADQLLQENGLLIVADYAWPRAARAAHIWKIRDVQQEIIGHADPPWAFRSASNIEAAARKSGLRLVRSFSQGLHDELSDADLELRFESKLSTPELNTLRLRNGFVITLTPAIREDDNKGAPFPVSRPRLATIRLSGKAEDIFKASAHSALSELNRLFTEKTEFDDLNNRAPLSHLAEGIRRRAEGQLEAFRIPDAGVFEVWTNLGLREAHGREQTRFIPSPPIQWKSKYPDKKAGVLSAGLPSLVNDSMGRPFAGRIAIPYRRMGLSGSRSIHQYFTDLHKGLRESKGSAGPNIGNIRSLTILAQDRAFPNSSTTALNLSLASHWGDFCAQAQSGHYLVILPSLAEAGSEAKHVFVNAINGHLRRITKNLLNTEDAVDGPGSDYEEFLQSVFYRFAANKEDQDEEKEFDRWLDRFGAQEHSLPDYRVYSTIVVGCDGLSVDHPDSLMLFSTQALPPAILDSATEHLASLCRRLSSLESEIVIEREAASHAALEEREIQHRVMVASFGHDGKRPASTIELLLRSGAASANQLARMLSQSLVVRLEAFSSLLDAPDSVAKARFRLRSEAGRAEWPWTTLRAIWEEEALNVLLRILVDGSGFQAIRDNLFGEGVSINTFEKEFAPLIGFLLLDTSFDFEARALAVRESLVKFAERKPGFAVRYDGPEVRLPYVLRGTEGGSRVPLARPSLAFLLSEMLTNTAKHQWPSLKSKLKTDGIQLLLCVTNAGTDLYDVSLLSQPVLNTSPTPNLLGEDRTVTGLMSLRMVADGVGIRPECKPITVNGESRGDFPYPENRELCWNGNTAWWSAYTLRGLELIQPTVECQ